MQDPQQEMTAVLSDRAPVAIGPSDTAQLLLDESDLPVEQLSQGQLVWRRFRRHKVAMIGAVTLCILVVIAIIGPYISPESPMGFDYMKDNVPPQLSWRYLLGTDVQGHAIIMYILYGARASLEVGILASLLSTVLGIAVGAVSGYFGGWVDAVWMRITDVFLTLPFLPMVILLSAYLGGGNIIFIILIFTIFGWTGVARLVRSYYLTYRSQEFTEAARSVGVSDARIIFRHILPNTLSPVIVAFTLAVAGYIIGEAAIDFLGVGLKPPAVSWGLALSYSQDYVSAGNWWWAFFPGLCLLITVLAVNFLGDGLRDALDVRAKTQ